MTKWFRLFGRLEGLSFLILLFIAVPLKYYAHIPALVRLMGPIHGAFFLIYCAIAYWNATKERWSTKQHLLAYAAAVVPFGPFLFERKFMNATRLA
jgi:integral membrane protein